MSTTRPGSAAVVPKIVREKAPATCLETWPVSDGFSDHYVRLQPMQAAWLYGTERA